MLCLEKEMLQVTVKPSSDAKFKLLHFYAVHTTMLQVTVKPSSDAKFKLLQFYAVHTTRFLSLG